jgi:hypothetical protein
MGKQATVTIETSEYFDIDDEDHVRQIAEILWEKRIEMLDGGELEYDIVVTSIEDA